MTDLRVLVVEDSTSDVKLITHELRKRYADLRVERVEDAEGMRRALAEGAWDVILSDWTMPTFTGLAALELMQGAGRRIPFIIVSGSIGEETAVDAMRRGASDYVLKDKLTRLPAVVEREVREERARAGAERERVEAAEALRLAKDELERRVAQRTEELRLANEDLVVARDAAESANRAKSAFLANLSHEIRTPMNAILGYTQLMERSEELTPVHREHVAIIHKSGDHLLGLLNDVLEMSKIEAGQRRVVRRVVDLHALIDDMESLFRLRAAAGGLALRVGWAADLPRYVVTDEGKLRQILVNLIGNAVKFTSAGSVDVRAEVRAHGEGGERIAVVVRDTGPGIGADEQGGLFRPFAQARAGLDARGGTGLGLALSREFARLLGGEVALASELGTGSTFTLEIPLDRADAPETGGATHGAGRVVGIAGSERPRRVVVVDDDDDSRGWLSSLLRCVGLDVRTASNGAEALGVCKHWLPHLVLTDLSMPVMDGYALMRSIRSLSGGASVRLVAVTAAAFDDARDSIFGAGADGWLRKPCREQDLLDELRRQLAIEYVYAEATPPPASLGPEAAALLADVPPELVAALKDATRAADVDQLRELVASMDPAHARVAAVLRPLVDGFAYDRLELFLSRA